MRGGIKGRLKLLRKFVHFGKWASEPDLILSQFSLDCVVTPKTFVLRFEQFFMQCVDVGSKVTLALTAAEPGEGFN